jgi:hypothetical protein
MGNFMETAHAAYPTIKLNRVVSLENELRATLPINVVVICSARTCQMAFGVHHKP